jgi:hypothetical protein
MEGVHKCGICNKEYKHASSLSRHKKGCESAYERLQQERLRVQAWVEKNKLRGNKSFKMMNRRLMESHDRSHNQTVINQNVTYQTTNSNNQITNNHNHNHYNVQILQLGDEQIVKTLTFAQKKEIMDSRMLALDKIVEIVHCGSYPQFKNILITNLKNNFIYRFDASKGHFVVAMKEPTLQQLVETRLGDLEETYFELAKANKIDQRTKEIIQKFLAKMGDDDTRYSDGDQDYPNFKSYQISKIRIMLFNNADKITRDIAMVVEGEDDAASASEPVTLTNQILSVR